MIDVVIAVVAILLLGEFLDWYNDQDRYTRQLEKWKKERQKK